MFFKDSPTRRFLSFPWLAWDVINIVRRSNLITSKSLNADERFSFDPLSEKVSQHIDEYLKKREKTMKHFFALINNPKNCPEIEQVAWANIKDYCRRHKGLIKYFFF